MRRPLGLAFQGECDHRLHRLVADLPGRSSMRRDAATSRVRRAARRRLAGSRSDRVTRTAAPMLTSADRVQRSESRQQPIEKPTPRVTF